MTFRERLQSLGFDAYLAGQHWRDFKAAHAASDRPHTCAVCNSSHIELHHHEYGRLGAELLTDVDPLCRTHHARVHEILEQRGWFVGKTAAVIQSIRQSLAPKPQKRRKAKKSPVYHHTPPSFGHAPKARMSKKQKRKHRHRTSHLHITPPPKHKTPKPDWDEPQTSIAAIVAGIRPPRNTP